MNINVDAAQSQREWCGIVEPESLVHSSQYAVLIVQIKGSETFNSSPICSAASL